MSDKLYLLLKLLNENKSISEISNIMKINYKELYQNIIELEKKSKFFNREYTINGDIYYKSVSSKKYLNEDYILHTEQFDNEIKAIALSDLHLCSNYERLDLLNEIYNYAIKNNIHIILNCGDLVDGLLGNLPHLKSIEQINYLISKYPFDNSILNFICLGNHDESLKIYENRDIAYYLKCKRHDLICLGYGSGFLNIKKDQIILKHAETNGYKADNNIYENKLILKGHTHFMKYICDGSNNIIYVPSLSEISPTDLNLFPSSVVMNLKMCDGYFVSGVFSQLMFNGNKFIKINTIECDLSQRKSIKNNIQKKEKRLVKNK